MGHLVNDNFWAFFQHDPHRPHCFPLGCGQSIPLTVRCCGFSCHIHSWQTLLSYCCYSIRQGSVNVFFFLKMLLVIPGRKWILLLHALSSSNHYTSLQGIFKLMTLYLSSTETFNLIFQVDLSQWILATTALNKTHLTVLHAIFRRAYYQNINFCYRISFSGSQYKAYTHIDNVIKVFITESPQVKLNVCIYSFANEETCALRNLNQNTIWTTLQFVCWSHDLLYASIKKQQLDSTVWLWVFFFISTSYSFHFKIFFIYSANTKNKTPNY